MNAIRVSAISKAIRSLTPQQLRDAFHGPIHAVWPQPITWADGRLSVQVQPSPQALARQKAEAVLMAAASPGNPHAAFEHHLTMTRLKLWELADGDNATAVLASLAVVIGAPCEAGSRQFGREPAWVRQLHGALCAARAMCLDGYRWQAAQAPALDHALLLATKQLPHLDRTLFLDAFIEANALASDIEARRFRADQIA